MRNVLKNSLFIIITLILLCSCKPKEPTYQGYIEARFAYISVPYQGVLKQLFVRRGNVVAANQPLFTLEKEPEDSSQAQAKADLDNAIAEQTLTQGDVEHQQILLKRREYLVQQKALAQEDLDIARINYKDAVAKLAAATAKVNSARANFERSQWTSAQKAIVAEQAGTVFDTYFLPSELVPANRPILSLIFPGELRAVFFIKETKLSSLKVKQIVHVSCDGHPQAVPAYISFISPKAELTPPVLYSEKERAKFVYRIEAEPTTADLTCFHPGQPITVTL